MVLQISIAVIPSGKTSENRNQSDGFKKNKIIYLSEVEGFISEFSFVAGLHDETQTEVFVRKLQRNVKFQSRCFFLQTCCFFILFF